MALNQIAIINFENTNMVLTLKCNVFYFSEKKDRTKLSQYNINFFLKSDYRNK